MSIFDSREDEAVTTPVLLTAVYRHDPANLASGDVVGRVNNLLFFDFKYLRMGVDRDYASVYLSQWNEMEIQHAVMRPVMFVVRAAMTVGGILTAHVGGLTMVVFGMDMVASSLFGVSPLDRFLSAGVWLSFTAWGRNTTFMQEEAYSFFQFTSSHAANLILTQLTFMAVGGGLGGLRGLRGVLSETAKGMSSTLQGYGYLLSDVGSMASRELLGVLRSIPGGARAFAVRYLTHLFSHLVGGTLFLYTLGAIGSAFGDDSLIAEMALQLGILASVIVQVKQHSLITGWVAKDSGMREAFASDQALIEEKASESSFLLRWLGIARLKAAWSVLGEWKDLPGSPIRGTMITLLGLEVAMKCLQVATVVGQVVV